MLGINYRRLKLYFVLIIQNDVANRNIDKVDFKGVSVIPMTTNISGGNLRVMLEERDNLKQISEICINELCTLDMSRIQLDNLITTLTSKELNEVNEKLQKHLGL